MTQVSMTGPAPYIYASTRMRVRKSHLLPKEEYLRMLNMELPEITRVIEETEYKNEIDELVSTFGDRGLDLVETALSWNLAKETQRVTDIMPGVLKAITREYLAHWDIYNVLTILRGKAQGLKSGRIKEVLIPAGVLDKAALDRLLNEDTAEKVVDALAGWEFYPVLEREFPNAVETGSFGTLENELYKAFYASVLKFIQQGVKGGKPFRDYLSLEIATKNVITAARIMKTGATGEVRDWFINGGAFSADELVHLSQNESLEDIVDAVRKKFPGTLAEPLEEVDHDLSLHEMENLITRVLLGQMDRISRRYPVSICPTLVYLRRKRYEVENLRAIARGKESGLDSEQIRSCLVM